MLLAVSFDNDSLGKDKVVFIKSWQSFCYDLIHTQNTRNVYEVTN